MIVSSPAPVTADTADTPVAVLSFPEGLFGFPQCRDFALTTAPRPGFYWLRSLEHEPLAFLLVDPFLYFRDYAVEVGEADLAAFGLRDTEDLAVLCIVTLPRLPGEQLTANLQGPLVMDLGRGIARQIIVQDSPFGLRVVFGLEAAA